MQSQLAADPGPNRPGRTSPPTSAEGDSDEYAAIARVFRQKR
jgi:hypothetical protein